jgi:hypothetical protein
MAGMARLHGIVAEHVRDAEDLTVVVRIETERGPWVRALIAAAPPLSGIAFSSRGVFKRPKAPPGSWPSGPPS